MKTTIELTSSQAITMRDLLPAITVKEKDGRFFVKLGTTVIQDVITELKRSDDTNLYKVFEKNLK